VIRPPAAGRVGVAPAPRGGWDVTATVGDRVVARRHCRDWHRTERAVRELASALERRDRSALHALVALMCVLGIASAATAWAQDAGPRPAAPLASSAEVRPIFDEPAVIGRAVDFATRVVRSGDGGDVKNGLYPELSNMVTGAGWISGGPGYRHWLFGDRLFVDASAGVSWRLYRMAQARVELPTLARSRLAVGSQVRWQELTQITYFGQGADTPDAARSEYGLESTEVMGYVTVRPRHQLAVDGRLGWLMRPTLSPPSGAFQRGNPSTHEVFPDDPVWALDRQPNYARQELALTYDTRDHRGRPLHGALYRAAWTRYADQDGGPFTFRRSEIEAAQFVPVAGAPLVLALHGWLVGSQTSRGDAVPFYLLPSLGGNNTVRAYTDYRFHDRNLLVVNAEARAAVFRHVDAALFVDAGNVAPRLAELNLDKRAVGLGVRLHTDTTTFARLDVAHGDEGWALLFRVNDPLRLSRVRRRTAAAPFVP
jgi:hypothetical protein